MTPGPARWAANVTSVAVTCVTSGFTVGGTVTGLDGTGLVLRNNGGDSLPISANGAFTFPTPVVSGVAYSVTVATQPSSPAQTCTVANATGTVGSANVTSVTVNCPPLVVLQKWQAPVTWGGTATSFWSDSEANLVEHLVFSPSLWRRAASLECAERRARHPPAPGRRQHGRHPLRRRAVRRGRDRRPVRGDRGDDLLDIQGDFLVCAVVKPDWNPVTTPTNDSVIMAKGVRDVSGWALMQSGTSFSFAFQASSDRKFVFTETELAMPLGNPQGPLNPSYVVVCGGRDTAGAARSPSPRTAGRLLEHPRRRGRQAWCSPPSTRRWEATR